MARTLIAIFESFSQATEAASELNSSGFAASETHTGEPAESVGGTLLTVTSNDGPLPRVLEILHRHHPLQLDQHTQGYFDGGDNVLAGHVPSFNLPHHADEPADPTHWSSDEHAHQLDFSAQPIPERT
ncbi:MAG TPA: hypothetical protein VER17_06515 [Tepidisphaeraceae bacterium]|nr:hypothetical protein [Tepidisphaeraceae bacterium]